ncbi:hypothetical protein FHR37_004993 [Actinopolymorpha cephalotaxi]|uniref:Uncharacterized protein n=1 Tax=Actinopolymorpha cephalotaxi TaxID=504797 RepID=A0ABX2SCY8_9ACTN|nr:hypothetical protein [Actinopolymorpha cephalotaxi]
MAINEADEDHPVVHWLTRSPTRSTPPPLPSEQVVAHT